MGCAVNPIVFQEKTETLTRALTKHKIAVIGGGIAGMEAARTAAIRGHEVTLYEKSEQLGGALVPASVLDFKEAERRLIAWYKKSLEKEGVKIILNATMDAGKVKALNVDTVVVATGGLPKMPTVKGIDGGNVFSATEILLGKKETRTDCVVIGGGQVGCEIAVWLKKQGGKVTIVEALDSLLVGGEEPVPYQNMRMLLDMLAFHQVDIKCAATVKENGKQEVVIETKNETEKLPADTVVVSVGYKADDSLYNKLYEELPASVWKIGDASLPTNIYHAVRDGYFVGKSI
jgi:2-enoate reductase